MSEAADQRAWAIRPEPQREGAISVSAGPSAAPSGTAFDGPPSRAQLVGGLLQAAWRRRFLLVVPLLLMLPVSLGFALLVPGTFTAHTLLLLQEGEKGNPLARDTPLPGSMQQRAAGLEALLKSNQVLIPILSQTADADPKRVSQALQELRKDLTLELIGADFISINLRGSKSEGLGDKLSRILARFFEVLLAENAPNAANVIIQRRRDELQAAENEKNRLQAEIAKAIPAGSQATKTDLDALEAKLRQQRTSNDSPDQLREAEQAVASLRSKLHESAELQQRLAFAERELARQRANYETYLNRFGDLAGGQGASVLNAPGRIKVIDPAKDPVSRDSSRLKFLVAGLVGAILIGVGLAWAAESLDPVIRTPSELTKATRLPVLATLPRLRPSAIALAAEGQESSHRHWKLAAAIVLIAALIGFSISIGSKASLGDGYIAARNWVIGILHHG